MWYPNRVSQPSQFAAMLQMGPVTVVAVLAMVGCFGEGAANTGTVSGKVSCNGQSIPAGRIAFVSDRGHGASGEINANGEFTLRTIKGNRILVGDYRVAIMPPPTQRIPTSAVPADDQKSAKMTPIGAPGDPVVQEYPDIPLKYRSPATSGLNATVVQGENRFDFDMKR